MPTKERRRPNAKEAEPKPRPGDLLAVDPGQHKQSGANSQAPSSPTVRFERRGMSVFVWVDSPPWGMGDCRREFIGRGEKRATEYLVALGARLAVLAEREEARRAAILRERQQERNAPVLGLLARARETFR